MTGVRRGLVLGAGGVLGFTWMVAALRALEDEEGFDARDVDLLVGTSAGSVLAAVLGCGIGADVALRHQQGVPRPGDPDISWDYDRDSGGALPPRPGLGIGSPGLLLASARRPGSVPALATMTAALPPGRGTLGPLHRMVTRLSGDTRWPERPPTRVVAMDYGAGTRTTFGAPGAPPAHLADAVAASCAIPGWYAPVRIGDRRYVDGGTLSPTSLDLLVGEALDHVYVLAPMVSFSYDRPRSPIAVAERGWRRFVTRRVLAEAAVLRAAGTAVTILGPDAEDLRAIGANLMDPRRRAAVLATASRTTGTMMRRGGDAPLSTGAVS
jgi:NTE family protein